MSPRFCGTELAGRRWGGCVVERPGESRGRHARTQGNRSSAGKSDNYVRKEGLEIVVPRGRMRLGKVLLV